MSFVGDAITAAVSLGDATMAYLGVLGVLGVRQAPPTYPRSIRAHARQERRRLQRERKEYLHACGCVICDPWVRREIIKEWRRKHGTPRGAVAAPIVLKECPCENEDIEEPGPHILRYFGGDHGYERGSRSAF